jgi:hypothetical protein
MKASKRTADARTSENGGSSEERDRFARFAKKLVNVPKKEIDEKAKEWDSRSDRPRRSTDEDAKKASP